VVSGYNSKWTARMDTRSCVERGSTMSIDCSKVSQALAKAIAYKQCGKEKEAEQWAKELIRLLELAQILK
jgi:hypothetical protein